MTHISAEPEDRSGINPQGNAANCSPAIGIAEHAALIEAIRLNFPEIYQLPGASEEQRLPGETRIWRQVIHPPAPA